MGSSQSSKGGSSAGSSNGSTSNSRGDVKVDLPSPAFIEEQKKKYGSEMKYKCTPWKESHTTCSRAKVEDLIEFGGALFRHWSIYAGKDPVDNSHCVIHHLQADAEDGGTRIRYDKIDSILDGKRCRINNKYDNRYSPWIGSEIMKRAYSQLDNCGLHDKKYDMNNNNCEHFATWCRNGTARSDQSELKNVFNIHEWKDSVRLGMYNGIRLAGSSSSSGMSTASASFLRKMRQDNA